MSSEQSGDLLGLGTTIPGQSNGARPAASALSLSLSSNNPFRNRAVSPNSTGLGFSPPPPRSPFDDPLPQRPSSRNPFLEPSSHAPAQQPLTSPQNMSSTTKNRRSPTAEELFDNLIIDDTGPRKPQPPTELKARPDQGRPFMSRTTTGGGPGRGENQPPRGGCAPPLGSHRLSRSQEEAQKARRMQAGMNGDKPLPGSPQRRTERRPRRNSESSVMDKPQTEEEKRRQRDRDRRHRDGKPRPRKIDIIDQLDATSIYGTGLFHHDGPFDACNPHRNRKGSRRAPMQAFAKDSANNSLGGSGPINKRPDHMQFMGTETHEATTMYGGEGLKKDRSNRAEIALWDPKQREVFEHGEESQGLGTSTFLEGAPAAATDIARHQAETAQEAVEGIGRKKSVVQRFRSIKRAPREPRQYGDRVTSPDAYYSPTSAMQTGASASERNPFFNEFDKGGEQITVKRKDSNVMSPMSPPGPSLERRSTADATLESEATPKQGGGFMSRVKSLKGGRRQPPAPPAKEYAPAPAPGAAV